MPTLTPNDVYHAAIKGGFSPTEAIVATQIAFAESSFNPGAVTPEPNGSTSYGLMQINSVHSDVFVIGPWADPVTNMKMAHTIYKQSGWRAWSTYKSGKYKELVAHDTVMGPGVKTVQFQLPGQSRADAKKDNTVELGESSNRVANVDAIGGTVSALESLGKIASKLTSPGFWKLLGIGGLGLFVIVIGIAFLLFSAKDQITKGAVGAVIGGK